MNKPRLSQQNTDTQESGSSSGDEFFLPDLCRLQSILFLLILTQLLAILFSLAKGAQDLLDWDSLGLTSIFSHWIVLSCAALLCMARPLLRRTSLAWATLSCMLVFTGITAAYTVLATTLFLPGEPSLVPALERNLLISLILGGVALRYFYLQQQWRIQRQAELQARLQALQARIRPHFLFNSMNTIASLIAVEPDTAEDALLDLCELFRFTLNNQKVLVPLEQELSLCRRYLNIESLRLGSRLVVDWKLDHYDGRVKIPPLTLQPLVENAIYHGIQPLTQGGTITIESYRKRDTVYVLITNPIENDEPSSEHRGNSMAMDNIRSRLKALYEDQAVLKTSYHDGNFTVTLRFPAMQSPFVVDEDVGGPDIADSRSIEVSHD